MALSFAMVSSCPSLHRFISSPSSRQSRFAFFPHAQKMRTMACLRENPKGANIAKDVESQNPLLSIAALCSLAIKEKATSDATIESMRIELKEKEATITSLEKKLEVEKAVRNEPLHQLERFCDELEEKLHCLYGVAYENYELQEKLVEEQESLAFSRAKVSLMDFQIEQLKKLGPILAEKEKELNELREKLVEEQESLAFSRAKVSLMNFQIEQLQKLGPILTEKEKELNELREKLVEEQESLAFSRAKVSLMDFQIEQLQKLGPILAEKEKELNELREKLVEEQESLAFSIAKVSLMDFQIEQLQKLGPILAEKEKELMKWMTEASNLAKQLEHYRNLCSKLEAQVSNILTEFAEESSEEENQQ